MNYSKIIKSLIVSFLVLLCSKQGLPQAGQLDTTFGQYGIVTTDLYVSATSSQSYSVAVQSDGKIVAVGTSIDKKYFTVVRYRSNGKLDNSFGTNGIVKVNLGLGVGYRNSEAYSTAIQKIGDSEKIVAAGYLYSGNSGGASGDDNEFAVIRLNQNGSLDNTFGADTNGVVITTIGSSDDIARSIAIQNDGKIVVAGYSNNGNDYDFAVVRYNLNGTLDNSFGSEGIVTTDLSGTGLNDQAYSIAIQNDEKIVVAGASGSGTNDFAIVRYNPNGFRDNTFGTNGIVITHTASIYDYALSIAIQRDEKIVLGGYSFNGTDNDFALARYNSNGSIDTSFGNLGIAITAIGTGYDEIWSIIPLPQNDGSDRILAAGYSLNGNNYDFTLARYNPDGKLDKSFGKFGKTGSGTGIITFPIGEGNDICFSAAIHRDNNDSTISRIFLSGYSDTDSINNFATACFNLSGEKDTTFGENGFAVTAIGTSECEINSLAIQPDNKIVTAGYLWNESEFAFSIARYNVDGSLDNTFGMNGIVNFSIGHDNDRAYSVAIQNDGKLVAAGTSTTGGIADFALVRFNENGTVDNSFGTNGIVTTDISSSTDYLNSIAMQRDGKIVAVGTSFNFSGIKSAFTLARYNSNGSLDDTFGTSGKVITPISTSYDYASAIAIQNDGKIVVAGESYNANSEHDFTLIRYNHDGSLDDSFGTSGIVLTSIGLKDDGIQSIAIQSDNKIIAAGVVLDTPDYNFALARYTETGDLDSTFGTNGIVIAPVEPSLDYANSVAIQSDGKIIAAGYKETGWINNNLTIRYNSDGTIDNTFGSDGVAITPIGISSTSANAVVIQNDGNIVIAGNSSYNNYSTFYLIRYTGDQVTGINENVSPNIPYSFVLEQNYPNPFNPTTKLRYSIPFLQMGHPDKSGQVAPSVQLRVFDILGKEVATLVNKEQQPGNYEVEFNASNLSSGVYFYKLQAGNFIQTKKMLLLK